jgi:hypothetical protein
VLLSDSLLRWSWLVDYAASRRGEAPMAVVVRRGITDLPAVPSIAMAGIRSRLRSQSSAPFARRTQKEKKEKKDCCALPWYCNRSRSLHRTLASLAAAQPRNKAAKYCCSLLSMDSFCDGNFAILLAGWVQTRPRRQQQILHDDFVAADVCAVDVGFNHPAVRRVGPSGWQRHAGRLDG